jgi:addiction module HigA family antidote
MSSSAATSSSICATRVVPGHGAVLVPEDVRDGVLTHVGLSQSHPDRVPVTRVNDIVNGKRGITADTALRLARYFGNSPEFWLNLQAS